MRNVMTAAALSVLVLACQPQQPSGLGVADGTYKAEADAFQNGWKDVVEVTVQGGKITAVTWDAVNEQGGPNKYQLSVDGGYKMKELGNAQAEWHEQVEVVKAWLLQNQSLTAPDAITGATINYKKFFSLVAKALGK